MIFSAPATAGDSDLLTQLLACTFTLSINFSLRLCNDFGAFLFCFSFSFVQNLRAALVRLLNDYLGFRFRFFSWSVALACARSKSFLARSAEAKPSEISFWRFSMAAIKGGHTYFMQNHTKITNAMASAEDCCVHVHSTIPL